jgi:hypothetical protein
MRDLGYLVQLFPDLTGKELMEIQRKDKEADEFEYQQEMKAELDMIKDINTNGGYYRGRFGIDQHYYYNFTNLRIEHKTVYCDCETLVMFTGEGERSTTKDFTVRIEKREYKEFDKYGIDIPEYVERVTKKEWDEVVNYLKKSAELFWPKEK